MIKRKLFLGLLMLSLLLIVVWLLANNQGHVLVVRAPYRIQFSFNFLLFLLVVGFFSFHYLLKGLQYLLRLPASWRSKQEAKRLKISHEALMDSLSALVNGDRTEAQLAAKKANANMAHPKLVAIIQQLAD